MLTINATSRVSATRPKVSTSSAAPVFAPVVSRNVSARADGVDNKGYAKTGEQTAAYLQKGNAGAIKDGFDKIVDSIKGEAHVNRNEMQEKQEDLKALRHELYDNVAGVSQPKGPGNPGPDASASGAASSAKSAANKAGNKASEVANKAGKQAEGAKNEAGNAVDAVKEGAANLVDNIKNIGKA